MKYTFILFTFLWVGCASVEPAVMSRSAAPEDTVPCFDITRLSADELVLADSIIYSALKNEALHTFISGLKPMSDVASFPFYPEAPDTIEAALAQIAGTDEFIQKYKSLNRIASSIECGTISAALFPFKTVHNGRRHMQLRVFSGDAVNRMILENPEFWYQWAFIRDSSPGLMIQVIEYEDRSERFRGYGYLYGYPGHAVDFFVTAAEMHQKSGTFVERDFVQMPVASGEEGRFVYAVNKGHELNEADMQIRELAQKNVDFFMDHASEYYREDKTFDAFRFLRDYHMKQITKE